MPYERGLREHLDVCFDGAFYRARHTQFFRLPSSEAANSLGMCTNNLKRTCRRLGLSRWPYRKFASLQSMRDGLTNKASTPEMHVMLQRIDDEERRVTENPNETVEDDLVGVRQSQ